MLARRGFQLTRWISNRRDLFSAFSAWHIRDVDLKLDNLPLDRALEFHWDVESDTIGFIFSEREQPENRKGVLSSIATVYDPLEFASLLQLPGRELCKLKLSWDDNLPEEIRLR